ncbi:MAG: hypothetical protein BWY79_01973 [Actinobacteria bacterium ADurb.Bin444]|nr:MAG: hypothetical protein BWY79_01973 [Actinobacteria bacterium ADurb.Bin444]
MGQVIPAGMAAKLPNSRAGVGKTRVEGMSELNPASFM